MKAQVGDDEMIVVIMEQIMFDPLILLQMLCICESQIRAMLPLPASRMFAMS